MRFACNIFAISWLMEGAEYNGLSCKRLTYVHNSGVIPRTCPGSWTTAIWGYISIPASAPIFWFLYL